MLVQTRWNLTLRGSGKGRNLKWYFVMPILLTASLVLLNLGGQLTLACALETGQSNPVSHSAAKANTISSPQTLSVVGQQVRNAGKAPNNCGQGVNSVAIKKRQVNLVLDDSGSMFSNGGNTPLDRWSNAKYSLEVFAALLGEQDNMNIYLTSTYAKGGSGPVVQLAGKEAASSRVSKIHNMVMQGGDTPYAPVQAAAKDLSASDAGEKWLVVLSDGAFNDRNSQTVQNDFNQWAKENTNESSALKVAFLAMGDKAPQIASSSAVIFDQAPQTKDLLTKVTRFANLIFARDVLPQDSASSIKSDIDIEELTILAQGKDVKVNEIKLGSAVAKPESQVEVKWANNADVDFGASKVKAVPNSELNGKVATFSKLPAGNGAVSLDGVQTVEVFYKPYVSFGVQLSDAKGKPVKSGEIVGGKYTVKYGFMDKKCNFIDKSPLLGDVQYNAKVINNGKVVADNFASGDQVELSAGSTQFNVKAKYLSGSTSEAKINLQVYRPAPPAGIQGSSQTYQVSKLNDYKIPDDAIKVKYGEKKDGNIISFPEAEWKQIKDSDIKVTSPKRMEFAVKKGDKNGEVFILPKAPNGDIYKADTGNMPLHIEAKHSYEKQLSKAVFDTSINVKNDISLLDRIKNWILTQGWKWLVCLLALLLIMGYIFKPRFSKRIVSSPKVNISDDNLVSLGSNKGSGNFVKSRLRRALPFVADTASFRYVPRGVSGFPPMKLKAARKGRIKILNWKALAARENMSVTINGRKLDVKDKTHPMFNVNSKVKSSIAGSGKSYSANLNIKK